MAQTITDDCKQKLKTYSDIKILYTEGSLISAQSLFSQRSLFGTMQIHCYMSKASVIRMGLSDLNMMIIGTFSFC